jgi:hypothetical protein
MPPKFVKAAPSISPLYNTSAPAYQSLSTQFRGKYCGISSLLVSAEKTRSFEALIAIVLRISNMKKFPDRFVAAGQLITGSRTNSNDCLAPYGANFKLMHRGWHIIQAIALADKGLHSTRLDKLSEPFHCRRAFATDEHC